MKRNNYNKNIIRHIFFVIFLLSQIINSEVSFVDDLSSQIAKKCKEHGETNRIKQFSDCNPVSNLTNNQVCCYVTGVNSDKTTYDGCIAVNSTLFLNKSIEYASTGMSGKLICTEYYNYIHFINISFYNLLLIVIIFL